MHIWFYRHVMASALCRRCLNKFCRCFSWPTVYLRYCTRTWSSRVCMLAVCEAQLACTCAAHARKDQRDLSHICADLCFHSVPHPSSIRGLATPWTYFLHLSLSSVILIDSSTESPVHVLMLSIQAVRVWSSSPACTWRCSLHYLFVQATPLFAQSSTCAV